MTLNGELPVYQDLGLALVAAEEVFAWVLFGTEAVARTSLAVGADGSVAGHDPSSRPSPGPAAPGWKGSSCGSATGVGDGLGLLDHLWSLTQGRIEWDVIDSNERTITVYRTLGARPVNGWTKFLSLPFPQSPGASGSSAARRSETFGPAKTSSEERAGRVDPAVEPIGRGAERRRDEGCWSPPSHYAPCPVDARSRSDRHHEEVVTVSSTDEPALTDIRQYWDQVSRRDRDDDGLSPTARDPYLQEVVESIMEASLHNGADVLDVGCGDGSSTLRFARSARYVVGVDYIPTFVDRARAAAQQHQIANATFEVGDVLDLGPVREVHGLFDIVTTIRCLINLSNWANQRKALEEIAKCLRPGGLYLLSEGWEEGMAGLNLHRTRVGLEPIAVAPFNRLMTRVDFEEEARTFFDVVRYESVGLYLFISRVVHPLFSRPSPPRHDHPLNKVAAELQMKSVVSSGLTECDYAGVYVLRRRAD